MTTSQMSWTIGEEAGKSTGDRDGGRDGPTSRCIAPMISAFIRSRWGSDTVAEATARGRALARTWLMDQEWGDPDDEVGSERRDAKRIKQIASGPNWHEAVQETARGEKQWVSFQASGVNSGSALKLSISLASKSKIQLLFIAPFPSTTPIVGNVKNKSTDELGVRGRLTLCILLQDREDACALHRHQCEPIANDESQLK